MKNLRTTPSMMLFLCFFLLSAAVVRSAELRVTPFAVTGEISGKKISIDKKFEQQHGMAVPAPFAFHVPRLAGLKTYVEYPEGKGGEYIKLSFATSAGKLLENLRFIPMQVSMGTVPARLRAAARVLVEQGFPMAVKGYLGPKILSKRTLRVGPYDAAEVTGQYEDATLGRMFLRLVALMHPSSRHCLLAFANAAQESSQVKTAADIGKKGITAVCINTVRFE